MSDTHVEGGTATRPLTCTPLRVKYSGRDGAGLDGARLCVCDGNAAAQPSSARAAMRADENMVGNLVEQQGKIWCCCAVFLRSVLHLVTRGAAGRYVVASATCRWDMGDDEGGLREGWMMRRTPMLEPALPPCALAPPPRLLRAQGPPPPPKYPPPPTPTTPEGLQRTLLGCPLHAPAPHHPPPLSSSSSSSANWLRCCCQ